VHFTRSALQADSAEYPLRDECSSVWTRIRQCVGAG
jgi:hypothetical protein